MGLKKIAEMRADLQKKAEALRAFTEAARQFSETYAKIAADFENVEKLRKANLAKVEALPTLGIKEFEDYKTSLESVFRGYGNRPLPTKPLEDVVAKQRKAVDDAVNERVAKLAAAFPAEVKPGMVFRFEPTKTLWEIKDNGTESKNPSHKGDEKIWYKYEAEGGASNSTSLANLKKSCKFIKA